MPRPSRVRSRKVQHAWGYTMTVLFPRLTTLPSMQVLEALKIVDYELESDDVLPLEQQLHNILQKAWHYDTPVEAHRRMVARGLRTNAGPYAER